LRPLDNTLRFLYLSKPEDSAEQATRDTWLQIEQTMLNGRALLLDSLSFGNEIRKEKALKSISPGYRKPSDREEVFGDDLLEIIQKENAANSYSMMHFGKNVDLSNNINPVLNLRHLFSSRNPINF